MTSFYFADEDRCLEFGLDPVKVESLARRIARAAEEAHALGIGVFGGSGTGTLRFIPNGMGVGSEVAHLGSGSFDGGDGGDK